jgi:hypothetical protein
MHFRLIPILAVTLLIAGCDIANILGPDPRVAQREADARAIGAACRYAMRGIEDCYKLNERAPKNSVFEGWKDMDRYMRENKMEGVASKIDAPPNANEAAVADNAETKKAASH